MGVRNKKKSLLLSVSLLLMMLGSVAHATFIGTINGWFPITTSNSVKAGGAIYALGTLGRPLRIVRLGSDNNLYITGQKADGTWDASYSLGGPIKSAPAVGTWSDSDQLIVAIGNDNSAYYLKYTPGTYSNVGQGWGQWKALGGQFLSSPAVTAKGSGRYYICGVGTDSRVWCGYLTTSGFSGWKRHDMPTAGGKEVLAIYSPAVGAVSSNQMELFMIGSDKRMYHRTWQDGWGNWTTWDDLGGQFAGSPAFAAWASDDNVVIGVGTDLAVWRKRFTGSNYLGGPWDRVSDGGLLSGSGLSAVSRNSYQYEILGEGQNYGLFYNVIHE